SPWTSPRAAARATSWSRAPRRRCSAARASSSPRNTCPASSAEAMRQPWARLGLVALCFAGLLGVAAVAPAAGVAKAMVLRGAGATLPAPLYEKWIEAYRRENPDVAITYEAVGSSEGQRRYLAADVDFGASDAALTDEQMARAPSGARLIPVTSGIVVLAYNVPGLTAPLRLGRDTYTGILA